MTREEIRNLYKRQYAKVKNMPIEEKDVASAPLLDEESENKKISTSFVSFFEETFPKLTFLLHARWLDLFFSILMICALIIFHDNEYLPFISNEGGIISIVLIAMYVSLLTFLFAFIYSLFNKSNNWNEKTKDIDGKVLMRIMKFYLISVFLVAPGVAVLTQSLLGAILFMLTQTFALLAVICYSLYLLFTISRVFFQKNKN